MPGQRLVVGADNVTLDLAGHRVFGNADRTGRDAGILLSGRKGVTVKGGTVEGFDAGVSVIGGAGNTIRDMVVRDNIGNPDSSISEYGDGIVLLFSKENSVLNNLVTHNGNYDGIGVLGVGSDRNLMQSLMFTDPNTKVLVRNNQVHGNGRSGIDVLSRSNRIVGNDASNNLTTFGGFDLLDENPECDNNFWSGNIWGSGGFSPACTAAGGHEAPAAPAAAPGGTSAEDVRAAAAAARWEPPPRAHPRPPSSGPQPGPR